MSNNKETNNPFDIFIRGARKGFTLATQNLLPNVLMAYTLAELLRILGIMAFLGNVFAPVMAIFGLPGESVTILLTAWLSYSAGVGVAVNLLSNNTIDMTQVTIMAPALLLMASQIQYMGRLLGVAEVPKKYWPMLMAISILNALISMLIMKIFV
jgi:spore maturation protein SpmB